MGSWFDLMKINRVAETYQYKCTCDLFAKIVQCNILLAIISTGSRERLVNPEGVMTEKHANRAQAPMGDLALLRASPFDWLALEYDRLKWACVRLQATVFDNDLRVSTVISWLKSDIRLQIAQERDELIPFLLARTEPDDDVSAFVERLQKSYSLAESQIEHLLAFTANKSLVPMSLRDDILHLAACERQHLALFSAIGLPLLRLRTPTNELGLLSDRLASGRGWPLSSISGQLN
jgi:hypothetical protein